MSSLWGGSSDDGREVDFSSADHAQLVQAARFFPLRLTAEERTMLTLCEGALATSEYTDNVDVLTYYSKENKILKEFADLFQIMSGLAVASNYRAGEKMCVDRTFEDNVEFFASAFEIVRRYKIMNPSKMRSDYGKLVHILQDVVDPGVSRALRMDCVREIATVHSLLEARGALGLLADPRIGTATTSISRRVAIGGAGAEALERERVAEAVRAKEAAVAGLVAQWGAAAVVRAEQAALPSGAEGPALPPPLSAVEVKLVLDSIADSNAYQVANARPVERMIHWLGTLFSPEDSATGDDSLAISRGRGGSCLTHSHRTQFYFVMQVFFHV